MIVIKKYPEDTLVYFLELFAYFVNLVLKSIFLIIFTKIFKFNLMFTKNCEQVCLQMFKKCIRNQPPKLIKKKTTHTLFCTHVLCFISFNRHLLLVRTDRLWWISKMVHSLLIFKYFLIFKKGNNQYISIKTQRWLT